MNKIKAKNHSHCWEDKEPACGKKFHAICCLCGEEKPKCEGEDTHEKGACPALLDALTSPQ